MGRYLANTQRAHCDETGKVCLSKADARRAARTLNNRQRRDQWPVHDFRCAGCGWYHTGHVPRQDRNPRHLRG